jgi:hypothetical protein
VRIKEQISARQRWQKTQEKKKTNKQQTTDNKRQQTTNNKTNEIQKKQCALR